MDTFSEKMASIRLFISIFVIYHWPLTSRYWECIPPIFLTGGLYGATTWIYHLGEWGKVRRQPKVTIWLKSIPTSMFWKVWFSCSRVWSMSLSERSLSFLSHPSRKTHPLRGLLENIFSYWFTLMRLWLQEMISRGLVTMSHLQQKFQTEDLGPLCYFLEIEVAKSKKRISLSWYKYMLHILSEIGMLECKATTPMDLNLKLLPDRGSFWRTRNE